MRKSSFYYSLVSQDFVLPWLMDRLGRRHSQPTRLHRRGTLAIRQTAPGPQAASAGGDLWRWLRPRRLEAWWAGRRAARSHVPGQAYLIWRLWRYLGRLPPHLRPWVEIVIDEQLETRTQPLSHPAAAVAAARLLQLERRDEWLQEQLRHVDVDLVTLEQDRQQHVAAGTLPARETMSRTAAGQGRPQRPLPWQPVGCALLVAVTLLAEAYQFALIYWNLSGIDPTALALEWQRNRLGVLAGSAFAFATALALCTFASWAMRSTQALMAAGEADPWPTIAVRALVPVGLGVSLILTAWGVGAMRHALGTVSIDLGQLLHGQSSPTELHTGVFVLLTILIPIAVAYLHDLGRATWTQQRQEYRVQHARWAHEVEQQRQALERYDERYRLLEDRKNRLLRAQQAAAQERQTVAHDLTHTERLRQTVLDALMAALALDRYYYERATRKRAFTPQGHVQSGLRPPVLGGVNGTPPLS